MGEGWLLTAEMLELIHSGTNNIVCTQPFGCLPNHIVGKGMIRVLKDDYPDSNIVAVDYDPVPPRSTRKTASNSCWPTPSGPPPRRRKPPSRRRFPPDW